METRQQEVHIIIRSCISAKAKMKFPLYNIFRSLVMEDNIARLYGNTKKEIPFSLSIGHLFLLFDNPNNPENPFPCGFSALLQQHHRALNRLDMPT